MFKLFFTQKKSILRWLYSILLTLLIPAILFRLWWKGFKNSDYRQRWMERFGFKLPSLKSDCIWVHAVSLGESVAAIPMIHEIQKKFPQFSVLVTTTTPTGSAAINNAFGKKVQQAYFPYDIPFVWKRFVRHFNPKILIILETELWPNCLFFCKTRKIPVIIVNGCLSLKSMRGYQLIPQITQEMLESIHLVAAQSVEDGTRYLTLGLPENRLVITGNMKFDVPLKETQAAEGRALKALWKRPIFLAASTHRGEEEQILVAFEKILTVFKDVLLIIAPRHPERFKEILALTRTHGYSVVTRSSGISISLETQIFLVDTLGELSIFYAASDTAYVGGSLVSIGGHNVLEAAILGVPIIVGPYTENIVEVTKILSSVGSLVQIEDSTSLAEAVIYWFQLPKERLRLGARGKEVVEKNRGALSKVLDLIEKTVYLK